MEMAECVRASVEFLCATFSHRHIYWHFVVVVTLPNAESESALFEIIDAIDALRFSLG
ncbi:MAG: hypothetical protein WDM76_14040 [Limisphaerales bacterium]